MNIYLITRLMSITTHTKEENTERELNDLILNELVEYINNDDDSANKESLCWIIDYKDDIVEEIKNQETFGYITNNYCDIDTVFSFVDDITSIYTTDELKFQFRWWFGILWNYCKYSTNEILYLLNILNKELLE